MNEEEELKVVNSLTVLLKDEIIQNSYKQLIESTAILRNNFSELFLNKLIYLMKPIKLGAEDILFYEGDMDDQSLYIIDQGEIELFNLKDQNPEIIDQLNFKEQLQNSKIILTKLKAGECFGQIEFFTQEPRSYCAKSIDASLIYKINQQEFLQLLRENPNDYENFCMVKDCFQLHYPLSKIGIYCYLCNSRAHLIQQCPQIHYIPDTERIIKQYIFPVDQPSLHQYQRKKPKKKYHALGNMQEVLEIQNKYQRNLINFRESMSMYSGNISNRKESIQIQSRYQEIGNYRQSMSICSRNTSTYYIPPPSYMYNGTGGQGSTYQRNRQRNNTFSTNNSNDIGTVTARSLASRVQDKTKTSSITRLQTLSSLAHIWNIDKIQEFKNYFPWNNIEFICQKRRGTNRKKKKMAKYTFYLQEKYFPSICANLASSYV